MPPNGPKIAFSRTCIAAAVAGLTACYGTHLEGDAPEDPGADAPDTGTPDTAFDTADVGPDTHTDAAPDAPADTAMDVPADTALDAPWEVPPEVPTTTCSIVDQTGCPDGTWCSWSMDDFTCEVHQSCFSRTAGTIAPGARCEVAGAVMCRPGSQCWWNAPVPYPPDWDTSTCHEWCSTDADCTAPGSYCGFELEAVMTMFGPCAGVLTVYPYLLCYNPEA